MAERTSRVRLYDDELEQLHDFRDRNYDHPSDIPLGRVIMDLIEESERNAVSQSTATTVITEDI